MYILYSETYIYTALFLFIVVLRRHRIELNWIKLIESVLTELRMNRMNRAGLGFTIDALISSQSGSNRFDQFSSNSIQFDSAPPQWNDKKELRSVKMYKDIVYKLNTHVKINIKINVYIYIYIYLLMDVRLIVYWIKLVFDMFVLFVYLCCYTFKKGISTSHYPKVRFTKISKSMFRVCFSNIVL